MTKPTEDEIVVWLGDAELMHVVGFLDKQVRTGADLEEVGRRTATWVKTQVPMPSNETVRNAFRLYSLILAGSKGTDA